MKTIKEELIELINSKPEQDIVDFVVSQPITSPLVDLKQKLVNKLSLSAQRREKVKKFIQTLVEEENLGREHFEELLEQLCKHMHNIKDTQPLIELQIYEDKDVWKSSFKFEENIINKLVEHDEARGNASMFIHEGELPQSDNQLANGGVIPSYEEITKRATEISKARHGLMHHKNRIYDYRDEACAQLVHEYHARNKVNEAL